MLNIPPELAHRYTVLLERNGIAAEYLPHFKKWISEAFACHCAPELVSVGRYKLRGVEAEQEIFTLL